MSHNIPNDGAVTVEVIDKISQAESEHPEIEYPENKTYKEVEILESGWIRCVGPKDRPDSEEHDGEDVDYFPPHLVNGIYTIDNRLD